MEEAVKKWREQAHFTRFSSSLHPSQTPIAFRLSWTAAEKLRQIINNWKNMQLYCDGLL